MIQIEAECLAQVERPASKLAFRFLVSPKTGGLLSAILCSRLPNLNASQFRSDLIANSAFILVAEDDADRRELVQLILRHAGFRVSMTGDRAEVMQLLVTARFDAVLLDNWMPKINGIELCRLIRSLNQKLPIFFCSGAVTEGDKKAAFAADAQGYFGKPFDPEELSSTLRAAVKIQPI